MIKPLLANKLAKKTKLTSLKFKSTADLKPLTAIFGQARAQAAVEFALSTDHYGYNIFAAGPVGAGKRKIIEHMLAAHQSSMMCYDWCYVHNFQEPNHPVAIRLPVGTADDFQWTIHLLVQTLTEEIAEHFSATDQIDDEALIALVEKIIDPVAQQYDKNEDVLQYLQMLGADVVVQVDELLQNHYAVATYQVNKLIENSAGVVPIIFEPNPTVSNLIGRVEQTMVNGSLITGANFIRAGALHRANGGYLLLDASRLLSEPNAWSALKRALYMQKIQIEPTQHPQLLNTVACVPRAIPLTTKVILFGSRDIYYHLCEYDDEFADLFKIVADFSLDTERSVRNQTLFCQQIAAIVEQHNLLHFERAAVAIVLDQAVRQAEDSQKISTCLNSLTKLLTEASIVTQAAKRHLVQAQDVAMALQLQRDRQNRVELRMQEAIKRDVVRTYLKGEQVGQINALVEIQVGNYHFGQPARVSATARQGDSGVVDIEREVDLGGSIHSKGVLILTGFLGQHYLIEKHLILSARIVFEQSYAEVDGDSASVAELCALLSAIGQIPINQQYAVTGSVDQYGQIQAVGAINEKIEGFFAVCKQSGLTGKQGVLIPTANVQHLMLADDVIDACRRGKFHIYAVAAVDDILPILMGQPIGRRGKNGKFTSGSIHAQIEQRLMDFVDKKTKESDET